MTPRLFALLRYLPLPVAHLLGVIVGWLFVWLPNRHRGTSDINLRLCFPNATPRERRRLRNHSLVETGKALFEAPILWGADRARLLRLVPQVSGREHLEAAMARGKGVILVAPHLGSWELLNVWCSTQWPMTSLYSPLRKPHLEDYVTASRARFGVEMLSADARGIRGLYQALKAGRLIGIPPDQDPREAGAVFAPFFRIPARTMTLIPRLLHKSGASAVMGFARRLPHGRGFHIHFEPAPPAIADPDPEIATRAMNQAVERCILQIPEQYQWSYKRFRTRPEGEAPIYR